MSNSSTLKQIKRLSVDKRIELVQEVWDSIAEDRGVPPMTDELRALLEQRLAEDKASPNDVVTWEEIKAELKARR
jgi:putative addiction module component (TIGR02574 family)